VYEGTFLVDSWFAESARWYLVLVAVSWGLAPVGRWLLGGLASRGAAVARPLALLAVIWPTWFLAGISPVPLTTFGLWLTLIALGVGSWFWAYRSGWVTREWLQTLLVVEALSLLAFAAYVGLRGFTPEITYTEQPMDIAFLTSSAMTREIPPADPWFAGEPINYYYLGYFVHGAVSRMANVPTWTGYNLALATTASMAMVAAGGVAFDAVRRFASARAAGVAAVLAGFLVVLAGNMHAPVEYLRDREESVSQWWWGTIGWDSSRIVVDTGSSQAQTINEFPWFSLLLGDLHPHLTALPFTILAIALALNLLFRPISDAERNWARYARLAVTGAVVGALYPLNSLDFPTYLVVVLGALLLRAGLNRRAAIDAAVLIVAAIAVWLPFTVRFVPFAGADESELPSWLRDLPVLPRLFTTIGWHDGERTSAGELLTVFGLFWAISTVYLVWRAILQVRAGESPLVVPKWVGGLVVIVVLAAVLVPAPVLILAGLPLGLALWLVSTSLRSGEGRELAVPALFAAAFGLIVLTEFFFVQDVFSGRYNTLFKVYYQAWTLLAIGSAIAAVLVIRELANRAVLQGVAAAALCIGLLAASAYPVIATIQWTRVHGERDWQGLDGAAYMAEHSAGDLAAIRWLYDNAEEDDVIVEAPGCSYQVYDVMPASRMSAFTGVPTIIGWNGHESQWRNAQPELRARIEPRAGDVAAIYADPSSELVDQYDATLLVVGSFEQSGISDTCEIGGPFPSVFDPEFPGPGWEEVFASGDTRIYRRVGA
jgi:YYY domain-containing protein